MQNKLQELTDKIYQEGIARGKEEAETIVAGARAESEKILKKAEEAAAAIMSKAEKDAEELRKNTLSEIRISFRHSSNALKQYLENLISKKVIEDPVSETFSDTSFVAGSLSLQLASLPLTRMIRVWMFIYLKKWQGKLKSISVRRLPVYCHPDFPFIR